MIISAEDFKKEFPSLAHLEGFELEDAMACAMLNHPERLMKYQPEALPDDNEIGLTIKEAGYSFNFTKGALREFKKFEEGMVPVKFDESKMAMFIPTGISETDRNEAGRKMVELIEMPHDKVRLGLGVPSPLGRLLKPWMPIAERLELDKVMGTDTRKLLHRLFNKKFIYMQEKHFNELTTTAALDGEHGVSNRQKLDELSKKVQGDLGPAPVGYHTPSPDELLRMQTRARELKKQRHSKRSIRKHLIKEFHVVIIDSWNKIINPQNGHYGK